MSTRRFWQCAHEMICHPLRGLWFLFAFGSPCPEWLDNFHDYTFDKGWSEPTSWLNGRVRVLTDKGLVQYFVFKNGKVLRLDNENQPSARQ